MEKYFPHIPMTEQQIEQAFIAKLGDLKYTYRADIHDRAASQWKRSRRTATTSTSPVMSATRRKKN
ncbi:MAG: hypothetical protein DPW15_17185, partial [Chloroflexi bacterium]|nr:hypothetical protein [Chloroflexota bacterium]